jgi:hypothetical protein
MMPWKMAAERKRMASLRRDGAMVLAVTVSGGVGDLIVIARFMRDLAANAEPFAFDVFVARPDVAQWIFGAIPGFSGAFPDSLESLALRHHDLELRIHQGLSLQRVRASKQRQNQAPNLLRILDSIQHSATAREMAPFLKLHPRSDNGLAQRAVLAGRTRKDLLHGIADIAYGGDAMDISNDEEVLVRTGLKNKDFITIHNGFDTNFIIRGPRATKCYPHFHRVVTIMKAARPELVFVQIGTTTSEPIPDVDFNLIGQTSLEQAAALLHASQLHLDNEGGLVHLAACYGRRSLVVFGPTPSNYFGYSNNININPLKCGNCWWMDDLWMDRCRLGMREPECMLTQPPENLAALALRALSK